MPCSWTYRPDIESVVKYAEPVVGENIKKAAWKKVIKCKNCGCGNAPVRRKRILGKEFNNRKVFGVTLGAVGGVLLGVFVHVAFWGLLPLGISCEDKGSQATNSRPYGCGQP